MFMGFMGFMASLNICWSWFHAAFLHQADQHSGNPGAAKGGRFWFLGKPCFPNGHDSVEPGCHQVAPLDEAGLRNFTTCWFANDTLVTRINTFSAKKYVYERYVCLCKLYFSRFFFESICRSACEQVKLRWNEAVATLRQPHRMLVVFHLN